MGFLSASSGVETVWERIESFCIASVDQQRSLDLLYRELEYPPYGVKAGAVPLLLAAFLLHRAEDIGVYKDGTFIPVLGPEHFELLVKAPERFSVKHFEIAGLRSQVFQKLEVVLKSPDRKAVVQVCSTTPSVHPENSAIEPARSASFTSSPNRSGAGRTLIHLTPYSLRI